MIDKDHDIWYWVQTITQHGIISLNNILAINSIAGRRRRSLTCGKSLVLAP
jgi:hypothetical protein